MYDIWVGNMALQTEMVALGDKAHAVLVVHEPKGVTVHRHLLGQNQPVYMDEIANMADFQNGRHQNYTTHH